MKYNKNEVTGKMRDRIILQNVNRSRSLTGFASESWADTATIWAFAESKLPGSNETIIDGKNTAKNVCDFTIRYISTITEESRVVWGDKLYQVKNIKVSHDRRFISFQGVFYDSYILTGVNVAASVTGIATTSANLKLIMSVIGQANAIASAIGEIVTAQQGLVEVASSVVANGTSTADVTNVVFIDSNIAVSANVSAEATIVQFVESSVQAAATSTADVQLTKVLESSVTADATATSAIDVIQQGLVTFEASVTATGTVTADLLRIATLESSSSTTADTSAIATLTKVLEASATATAQTSSDAQITIPVNADATATANTSADATLSYTVNAAADATAQTSADAFITRIISANATATANSSAEAGIGVTFVAAAVATATSTNADLFRTATIAASVTGSANVTAATVTTVNNVAASASAAATVSATLTISLLLDLYPSATAAYSLRKLRTAYTGSAIRVRRSSDNTEQDIGFSGNNLDQSALTTFVGANNGFVVKWYDQSGNVNNATQTTQANQPQIVNNGVVILTNTKPSIKFDGTNDGLILSNSLTYANTGSLISFVGKRDVSGEELFSLAGTQYLFALWSNNDYYLQGKTNGYQGSNTTDASTNQLLLSGVNNGTNLIIYKNNSVVPSTFTAATINNGINTIGIYDTSVYTSSNLQEIIFYNYENSTILNGLNTNINTHYAIY